MFTRLYSYFVAAWGVWVCVCDTYHMGICGGGHQVLCYNIKYVENLLPLQMPGE